METVEFVQYEIFEGDKRVAQFGGSAADRQKLTRKARTMAKRLIAKWQELNKNPLVWPCHNVSVRRWRGVALIDTVDGVMTLRSSRHPKHPAYVDNYVNITLSDIDEFYRLYTDECVRIVDGYERRYKF